MQSSYVYNSKNGIPNYDRTVRYGENTFDSVLAALDIQLYLLEPEYTTEEMQQREAEAVVPVAVPGDLACEKNQYESFHLLLRFYNINTQWINFIY